MNKIIIALNVFGVGFTSYYGWVISSLLYQAGANSYGLFVALVTALVALDILKELIDRVISGRGSN